METVLDRYELDGVLTVLGHVPSASVITFELPNPLHGVDMAVVYKDAVLFVHNPDDDHPSGPQCFSGCTFNAFGLACMMQTMVVGGEPIVEGIPPRGTAALELDCSILAGPDINGILISGQKERLSASITSHIHPINCSLQFSLMFRRMDAVVSFPPCLGLVDWTRSQLQSVCRAGKDGLTSYKHYWSDSCRSNGGMLHILAKTVEEEPAYVVPSRVYEQAIDTTHFVVGNMKDLERVPDSDPDPGRPYMVCGFRRSQDLPEDPEDLASMTYSYETGYARKDPPYGNDTMFVMESLPPGAIIQLAVFLTTKRRLLMGP